MLTVSILEPKDYGRLEALCMASPHGSAFSTPSWARHAGFDHICLGVHRGYEMVGGAVIPLSDGHVSRHVSETPWIGCVGRSESESENCEIAERLAGVLLARYPEATLTLPPEWTDIRPFTWAGMRAHVRYTYRGRGMSGYEKRLDLHDCIITRRMVHDGGGWQVHEFKTGDSVVTVIFDWSHAYYWKANKGGKFHADCVNAMIQSADALGLGFDMVGANSPQRGLFKRSFGGRLTPYYAVTTASVEDLREEHATQHDLREVSAWADAARACGV